MQGHDDVTSSHPIDPLLDFLGLVSEMTSISASSLYLKKIIIKNVYTNKCSTNFVNKTTAP